MTPGKCPWHSIRAFARVYGFLLQLQISSMEQRTISGSENFLKPERRHLGRGSCISMPALLDAEHFCRHSPPCVCSVEAGERSRAAIATCWVWNGNCRAGMATAGPRAPGGPLCPLLPPSPGRSRPRRARSHRAPAGLSGDGFVLTNCSSKR